MMRKYSKYMKIYWAANLETYIVNPYKMDWI